MRLFVVVLNWNQADDTRRCVDSIARWGREGVEVIVVENGSEANERFPSNGAAVPVSVIESATNRGFAGGNNLGVRAALERGADHLLLLNNDASIAGPDLERLERTLAEDVTIGVVGPTIWCRGRLLSAGGRDIARHPRTHFRSLPSSDTLRDVDYVPGAAVLLRRSVFEAVGLFDEDFFFGGEMADLCARSRARGIRSVIEPRARADHDLERSSAMRERLHVYYVFRNRFLFAKKHHARRRARFYLMWSALGLSSAARALLAGRQAQAGSILLGVRDALAGRFGGQNDRVL